MFYTKHFVQLQIKYGQVKGVPTARAIMHRALRFFDENRAPYYVQKEHIATVDFTIDPQDSERFQFHPVLRFKPKDLDHSITYKYKRTHTRGLTIHMIKTAKTYLDDSHACRRCGKGSIFFKAIGKRKYIGEYEALSELITGSKFCDACEHQLYPYKNDFDPSPETDDDHEPVDCAPALLDPVNSPRHISRQELIEDIDYLAALDFRSTKQFLSG